MVCVLWFVLCGLWVQQGTRDQGPGVWVQGRVLGRGYMPKPKFSGKTEVLGLAAWGTSRGARVPLVRIRHPCFMQNEPPPPLQTGVFKQDKSSRGSVDTPKTRSDPQRVRMSSGERPIGTVKGRKRNTEALCEPPPPSVQEPLYTRTTPWFHGTFRDTTVVFAQNWVPRQNQLNIRSFHARSHVHCSPLC